MLDGILGLQKLTPEQAKFFVDSFQEELDACLKERLNVPMEDMQQEDKLILMLVMRMLPEVIMPIRSLLPQLSGERLLAILASVVAASEAASKRVVAKVTEDNTSADTELQELRRMAGL